MSRPSSRVPVAAFTGLVTTGALLASLLLAPPAGAAPASAPAYPAVLERSTGVLSARLLALAAPGLATARGPAQADALSMARSGVGSLVRDRHGRVLVQVRLVNTAPATVARLRVLGEVVDVSSEMSRATLRIEPAALTALATTTAVLYADVIPAPLTARTSTVIAAAAVPSGAATRRSTAEVKDCRSVVSDADTQLRAAKARARLRADGTGVLVGVLSDSYDVAPNATTYARADVRSGDLPGPGNPCGRLAPVRVVQDYLPDPTEPDDEPTDEGRAMLQGVHGVAPGARLAFATASSGPDAFARNIRSLARIGAKVIVDDISYLTEPFFQSGVIDRAVHEVTKKGVAYFSSAGNSNAIVGGRNVASWETPTTRQIPCPDTIVAAGRQCVNFSPSLTDATYAMTLAGGGSSTMVVQWAQPVNAVTDDFDVYLIDPTTGATLANSVIVQSDSGTPVEYLSWRNDNRTPRTVQVVIAHVLGTGAPRLKLSLVASSGLLDVEYDRSGGGDIVGPTVFGHNGGPDTISVGAVPFDDAGRVEPYSARGPVTHYFGPVTGTAAARPLPVPLVIPTPTLAATDGYANTFFGTRSGSTWRFYGTSAAAPSAAGVAALMRAKNRALTPAQVQDVLRRTARRVGSAPAVAVGSGLVNAYRAVGYVSPPTAPSLLATARAGRGSVALTVRAHADPLLAPATAYRARCISAAGADPVIRSGAGAVPTSVLVPGLVAGKAYRCKVRTRTTYGWGPFSSLGAQVVPTGVPGPPTRVKIVAGTRSALMSFRAPTNTGGLRILGYAATCTPAGAGTSRSASGLRSPVLVRGLLRTEPYRCAVTATNRLGDGRSSPSLRVVPGL